MAGKCVRGEMGGRLQCGADIPAMDGEFKNTRVDQSVHGDNAPTMIAGFVPIVRVEGDDTLMELLPGLPEYGRQVVAEMPPASDDALCEPDLPLPPFLLRECLEVAWSRDAFRGSSIPVPCTSDAVRVSLNPRDQMDHDITNFLQGTDTGLGPGVRWQGGKILLQLFGLGLDDCDQFYLCGHGVSLLAVVCRINGRHVPLYL
jgi:hypothetical protein